MKPLVIYHADCADGFGAAFAAWLKFGDEAEYLPCQYGGDPSPDMWAERCRGREVFILDFSFPKLVMEHIFANAERVAWLDHHKTAFEAWCGKYEKGMTFMEDRHAENGYTVLSRIVLNDNKSGALLAWEYFNPGTEVPMFIRHIDDYDRWQFKIKGAKAFQKALWSHAPWSFEQWREIFAGSVVGEAASCYLLQQEGRAILRAHDQSVQAVVESATRKCSIFKTGPLDDGDAYILWQKDGLAANCPHALRSDVGHELAVKSGTYGLTWRMDESGLIQCSLRSEGDYDVSAIAKAFGGGGHRNAAGFTTDIHTLMGWLK